MADEIVVTGTGTGAPADEFVKANPEANPRNQALAEIAKTHFEQAAIESAESFPVVDDDGNVVTPQAAVVEEAPPAEAEAVTAEPPKQEPAKVEASGIDPTLEYEVTVEGQKIKVLGSKIIDAGFRTYQKEAAADTRLNLATQLLEEARQRTSQLPPGAQAKPADPPAKVEGPTDEDLAKAIQFGTAEQAADAIKRLKVAGTAVTPDQVANFVRAQVRQATKDEIEFQDAVKFVQSEYGDLFENTYLKQSFFTEENKRRAERAQRREAPLPYKELYKQIGEDLRTAFNKPKVAAGTKALDMPAKVAAKAAAGTPPRPAATRLAEGADTTKPKSASEIIAQVRAARGQDTLANRMR